MRGVLAGAFAAILFAASLSAGAQATASPKPSPAGPGDPTRSGEPRDREWFESHKDDPAFGDELLRAVRETADAGQAGLLLMDYAAALKKIEHRVQAADWLASLAEFQGRWDLAAHWHATSLEAREHAGTRLRHAVCLAKAGNLETALASIKRLPPASDEALGRGRVVKAWCLAAMGRTAEARAEAQLVIADPAQKALHAQALYLAAILEGALSDPGKPSPSRDALDRGWPGSPEALALSGGGGRVFVRPDPLLLLATLPAAFPQELDGKPSGSTATTAPPSIRPSAAPPSATPIPSASARTASPAASLAPLAATSWPKAYQVGYFAKRENALRLHEELRAKGFDSSVAERKARDGSDRWVVSVSAQRDPETVFLSLSEAGYDLYPLWD